jgi:hypothetical protein
MLSGVGAGTGHRFEQTWDAGRETDSGACVVYKGLAWSGRNCELRAVKGFFLCFLNLVTQLLRLELNDLTLTATQ